MKLDKFDINRIENAIQVLEQYEEHLVGYTEKHEHILIQVKQDVLY